MGSVNLMKKEVRFKFMWCMYTYIMHTYVYIYHAYMCIHISYIHVFTYIIHTCVYIHHCDTFTTSSPWNSTRYKLKTFHWTIWNVIKAEVLWRYDVYLYYTFLPGIYQTYLNPHLGKLQKSHIMANWVDLTQSGFHLTQFCK